MDYNIRGENIEVTPALRDYVEKKVGRVEKYFSNTPNATVYVNLKVYSDRTAKVEITIPMPNLVLRAEEKNQDMYAAVDVIVDKLERQIRKYKTRVNRKHRANGSTADIIAVTGDVVLDAVDTEEQELELVRTKRFDLKPMDSEEAILQMNMLGHNFFVYTNAETNVPNVVYKRKDGRYGLIEPNA